MSKEKIQEPLQNLRRVILLYWSGTLAMLKNNTLSSDDIDTVFSELISNVNEIRGDKNGKEENQR